MPFSFTAAEQFTDATANRDWQAAAKVIASLVTEGQDIAAGMLAAKPARSVHVSQSLGNVTGTVIGYTDRR